MITLQPSHDVRTTLHGRRFNVFTSYQRPYNVVLTSCAALRKLLSYVTITLGGLAVAVPGQVRGLKLAHKNHGKLQWNLLFGETIRLAREGFKIHKPLASAIATLKNEAYVSKGLR